MPRTVTVTFKDGTQHTYQNVPDDVTPDAINARAMSEFKQPVTNIDGGRTVDPVTVTAPEKTSLVDKVLGAIKHTGSDANDIVEGLYNAPGAIVHAALHPVQTTHAAHVWADHAADILTGGAQRLVDAIPGAEQPEVRSNTQAFDQFAQGLKDKYGSPSALYNTVSEHPLNTAIAAASVAMPALKAVGLGSKVADAASALGATAEEATAPVTSRVARYASSGRRAADLSGTMRDLTRAGVTDEATAAETAAADAQAAAARRTAQANKRSTFAEELAKRRAAARNAAEPPAPAIGDSAYPSDIGESVRAPAMDRQAQINAEMRAADAQYRDAMNAVAADREAQGLGVSDTLEAQKIIANSKNKLFPSSSVGKPPLPQAGGSLHNMALDVLQPENNVKPSLQNVDELRRFVGQIANGTAGEGFKGINASEARDMYHALGRAMDEYAAGTPEAVRKNWAAGKQALQPFENVKLGQKIVGVQDATGGVPAVPASSIPDAIVAGGRDTVKQAAAVAGDAPVASALRSIVQNKLEAAKNADAMEALVGPQTKLGDAIRTDPDLVVATRDYIQQVRNAEASGAQAEALGKRLTSNTKRADTLSQMADALNGNALKAQQEALAARRELDNLEIAPPEKVGGMYKSMLDRAHAAGKITQEQYQDGLKLADSAEQAFKDRAKRNRWLGLAGGAIGLGALSKTSLSILHGAGQ